MSVAATGAINAQNSTDAPKKLDPHIRISFIQPHPAIATGSIVPSAQMTNYLFTQELCQFSVPGHKEPLHLVLVARPASVVLHSVWNLSGYWHE